MNKNKSADSLPELGFAITLITIDGLDSSKLLITLGSGKSLVTNCENSDSKLFVMLIAVPNPIVPDSLTDKSVLLNHLTSP